MEPEGLAGQVQRRVLRDRRGARPCPIKPLRLAHGAFSCYPAPDSDFFARSLAILPCVRVQNPAAAGLIWAKIMFEVDPVGYLRDAQRQGLLVDYEVLGGSSKPAAKRGAPALAKPKKQPKAKQPRRSRWDGDDDDESNDSSSSGSGGSDGEEEEEVAAQVSSSRGAGGGSSRRSSSSGKQPVRAAPPVQAGSSRRKKDEEESSSWSDEEGLEAAQGSSAQGSSAQGSSRKRGGSSNQQAGKSQRGGGVQETRGTQRLRETQGSPGSPEKKESAPGAAYAWRVRVDSLEKQEAAAEEKLVELKRELAAARQELAKEEALEQKMKETVHHASLATHRIATLLTC